MAMDPICGNTVDEDKTAYKSEHQGTTYNFCSASCQRAFELRPDTIVKRIAEGRVPGMRS